MRTVTQMVARVQRLLNDTGAQTWTSTVIKTYMADALRQFCQDLMRSAVHGGRGGRILLRTTAPKAVNAYQDRYKLPSDLLKLSRIETRFLQTLHATMTCGTAGTAVVATWNLITAGGATFFLDDREYVVEGLDFSGASDMDGVASVIQAGVRAATGGIETVTWDTNHFEIACAGNIAPLTALPTSASTDIGGSSYMDGQAGAVTIYVDPSVQPWVLVQMYGANAVTAGRFADGTAAAFESPGATAPAYWANDTADGYVKIMPRLLSGTQYLYRFWYYALPSFPASDSLTIRGMPEGADSCVEYLTAAMVSMEALKDGSPIGAFGETYSMELSRFVNSTAEGKAMPSVKMIQRVR